MRPNPQAPTQVGLSRRLRHCRRHSAARAAGFVSDSADRHLLPEQRVAARKALDIRLRAERRIGELLAEGVDHAGGKRAASSNATLAEDIERMQSSRWQRVASLPEPVFEEELAKPEPSNAALVKCADLGHTSLLDGIERVTAPDGVYRRAWSLVP